MQTRRDYLIGLGLAKEGRGKFSREANAALDKARADGVKFLDDDGPVKTVEVKKADGSTEKVVRQDSRDMPWVSPDEYRFPQNLYRAFAKVGGKRVYFGMREACNNCGLSLCDHRCNEPSVLGVKVQIERIA